MGVKVHLEGDGLLFNDETTVFNAAQIIGFLKNSETLTASGPSATASPQTSFIGTANPRTSPRQALQESNAKTNPQKIAVLGNYQAALTGHDSFTVEEVKTAFRRAGEPLPKNLSRDVQTAVQIDLIFEAEGAPGYYVLTEKAQEYLDSGFTQQGKTAKKSKREGRRQASTSKVTLNQELLKSLHDKKGSLEEFIQARQMAYDKGASGQVAIIATWLLDEMGIDGISPSDLHAVRRYLGQSAGNPGSQLNNAKNREGYFSHINNGKFILSSPGQDFGRIKSKG